MPPIIISGSSSTNFRLTATSRSSSPSFQLSLPQHRIDEDPGTLLIPSWEYLLLNELGHHVYDLRNSIIIEIEYLADAIIARYNPIEMYGEGRTREEAIADLQASIIAYYECLLETTEEHLGPLPRRHWQRLNDLIRQRS
jgi:hypothetical protein